MRFSTNAISVCAVLCGVASAWADANHVPLDGSDKTVNPADFGYRIEFTRSNSRVDVRIFLTAPAAKSFTDGRLQLTKNGISVVDTVVGLQKRNHDAEGVLELRLDMGMIDDGELILWAAPIERQPIIKNFGGFRISIKQLLQPVVKKEVEKDPLAPPPSGITPEDVKRINELIRKSHDEQIKEQMGKILGKLNGKLEPGDQYSWLANLRGMDMPVAEAIPIWIGLLDSPYDIIKSSAMEELAKFGNRAQAAGPKMLLIFQKVDTPHWLRQNAILAMARVEYHTPELIDEYIKLLNDQFPLDSVRLKVIEAVGRFGRPAKKALPSLFKLMEDKSSLVQYQAYRAQGLIQAEPRLTVNELKEIKSIDQTSLSDKGFAILESFQAAGTKAEFGVPMLLSMFDKRPAAYMRGMLIETLGMIGASNPDTIKTLVGSFSETDPLFLTLTGQALARIDGGNEACVRALGEGLLHPSDKARQATATILAKLGRRGAPALGSAVAALKGADDKTSKDLLGAYLDVLSKTHIDVSGRSGPETTDAATLLLSRLDENAPIYKNRTKEDIRVIRAYTLAVLAKIGITEKAMPYIKEHLASDNAYQRGAGARAAAALGPQAADVVPLLIAALKLNLPESMMSYDIPFLEHGYVGTTAKEEVIRALGRIGPAAKEAIPALRTISAPEATAAIRQIEQME